MARDDNLSIVYPPGCRTVSEDLGSDELVRRLKTLAHTLQSMGQDDGAYQVGLFDSFMFLHDIFETLF